MSGTNGATAREWSPNEAQRRFLDVVSEVGLKMPIKDVCELAQVPRRTFYNWMMDEGPGSCPEFKEAYRTIWKTVLRGDVPSIVSAMVEEAQGGDVPAARLLLEMVGDYIPKAEMNHTASLADLVGQAVAIRDKAKKEQLPAPAPDPPPAAEPSAETPAPAEESDPPGEGGETGAPSSL